MIKKYQILTMVLIILLIGLGALLIFQDLKRNNVIYDEGSIYDYLEKIENNCGSTFITKKSLLDSNWYIFSNVCISGDYCKSDYIKLEDCLKD